MVDESDEEARRARAARLHAQIERTRSAAPPPPPPGPDRPDDEESPRDRITRRMRELDDDSAATAEDE
jgi:hypothetical protein